MKEQIAELLRLMVREHGSMVTKGWIDDAAKRLTELIGSENRC